MCVCVCVCVFVFMFVCVCAGFYPVGGEGGKLPPPKNSNCNTNYYGVGPT